MTKSFNLSVPEVEKAPKEEKVRRRKKKDDVELTHYKDQDKKVDKNDEEKKKKKKIETVGLFAMFRYAGRKDRAVLILGAILTMIGSCGYSIVVWYTSKNMTDLYAVNFTGNGSEVKRRDEILRIATNSAIVVSIVAVCKFILLFLGMMCWIRASDGIVRTVRALAFNNLVRQHMGFFDLNDPGAIITCLTEESIKFQSGIGEKVISSLTWLTMCISNTGVAFAGDWLLALICYAFLPVTLIMTGVTTVYIRKLGELQNEAYARAGVVAEESFTAIRIVHAFCGENKQCDRYEKRLIGARKLGQKSGYFTALANCVAFLISLMVLAVVLWIGTIRYLNGLLDNPGILIQVVQASGSALRNLAWVANNNEFITSARAAAASIYSYIEVKSEIDSLDTSGEQPSEVSGELSFEDVVFEYPSRPDVPVLTGLTMTIPRGRNVALVGPSGCGKSTTIQLIQRLYDPRQGVVKLDGKDVKKVNIAWLRKQIGVVAQEPTLFATTIEENIRFGRPGSTKAEIVQCAKDADAHDFIMELPQQYDTVLNESATLLSRGEKQRVSLARALVRQPKILLLDECTSALDTNSEVVVQAALEKASRGRTTITIAHRLSTVRNSDTLYIINEGVLWEQGNHEELMEKAGLYSRLVTSQMQGMEEKKAISGDPDDYDEEAAEEAKKLKRSDSSASSRSAKASLERLQKIADNEYIEAEVKTAPSLKRIFSYNRPETCLMVLGSICALIFGFGVPGMAILTGELFVVYRIDDVDEQWRITKLFCPILLGMAIVTSLCSFVAFASLTYAGEWLTQRIRMDVFRTMVKMEKGWYDRKENQVGSLTGLLAISASRVKAATGTVLVTLFSAFSTLFGAIIVGCVYGWKLGVPLLAYSPFTVAVSIVQSFVDTRFSQWTAKASREGGNIIAEVIDKIQVVASLTKEDFFEKRFNAFFEALAIKERKKAVYGGAAWGLTYFFHIGAYMLAVSYGLYCVAMDDIKAEDIARIHFGVAGATQEMARLNVYATEFNRARTSAAQLFSILDRKTLIDPHDPSGEKPEEMKGELTVNKCYFNYPTRQDLIVLKNLSFEVKRGQFIAIVGPSGSGKTTAISLFERFYEIMGGDVTIDGVPLTKLNLAWVRSQMAIVTQDPMLFNISLRENIQFGDNSREVSMDEVIQAAKNANIHPFIATLPQGYETPAGTKGTQLSGGQKQRVSIARALVRDPKLLLLDDAMSALDAESEKMVEVALENARQGRTTIMVSHRLSSILKADMIYYVSRGTVMEKGTHTELMSLHGAYYKLQQASLGLAE